MVRWSACVVATVLGSAVLAQADPTTIHVGGPVAAPQTATPYWNGGSSQLGDLPATDIRTVVVANANRVRTKWTFQQTLFDLNNAVRLVQMRLGRQPEYRKALDDQKAAYSSLETARTNALADLGNNSAYVGAETLHENVDKLIADEKDQDKPDPTRLLAMAKLKLQYVKDNRKLEASMLERDGAYQDAKRKYVDASQRVGELEADQALLIATDDNLLALRKEVADARINEVTARAFFDASVEARDVALNYAGYYRGIDIAHGYGNGYPTYGYSPYGAGLGNGFRY